MMRYCHPCIFSLLLSFFFQIGCVNDPAEIKPQKLILNVDRDTVLRPDDTLHLFVEWPIETEDYFIWIVDGKRIERTKHKQFPVFWSLGDTGKHTVIVGIPEMKQFVPDTAIIYVKAQKPGVTLHGPQNVSINDSAVFQVEGFDNDGFIKMFFWSVDRTADFWYEDGSGLFKKAWGTSEHGIHTVRVKAVDNDGLSSEIDSLQVEVTLDPPEVYLINRDTNIYIHDTLLIECIGKDSNGTVIGYRWRVDGQLVAEEENSLVLTWGLEGVGEHTVTVTAIDDDSVLSKPDTVLVRVEPGYPYIKSVSDTIISSIDSLILMVEATDPNGKIISYLWGYDGNGWVDTTIMPYYVVHFSGERMVSVRWGACDNHGLISWDTINIGFNEPPEIAVSYPRPVDTLFSGENTFPVHVLFDASITDPDKDSVSVELFAGGMEGVLECVYTGDGDSMVATFDHPGTYRWFLTVKDVFGNESETGGVLTVLKEYRICFVGHSIIAGMAGDEIHGGFRARVLKGLRDSLNRFERLRALGPVTTPFMSGFPQDDSCLAISGTVAREIQILLSAFPTFTADIWVLMMGANDRYSTREMNNTISLVDQLYERNSESRLFVLNSPPFPDDVNWNYYNLFVLPHFNQGLSDAIVERKERGYKIEMIDAFSLLTKDGLFDSTWFYDHVHPNLMGYERLGDEVLRIMFSADTPAIP